MPEPGYQVSVNDLLDAHALDVLDFDRIRDLLARRTATDRGATRARTLVPGADFGAVRTAQAATSEMRALVERAAFAIPRVAEPGDALGRAARGGTLTGPELRELGIALAAVDAAIRRVRGESGVPILLACVAGVEAFGDLANRIDDAIGAHGEVLDRASPELTRIRRAAASAVEDARERCGGLLRSGIVARAIQDTVVTVRSGRFVIPVKADFAGQVPGVVHDTSATGATLFIEPLGALEANNRLRTLRIDEEREIARVLAELSGRIGARVGAIDRGLDVLGDLDLALARVRVGEALRAVPPTLVDEARIEIRAGRHPLLGEEAVPQTLALDETARFIVISGPNMGGKTVALKLLGIFVAMAYCGFHLPAAPGTTIGAFDRILCDIGDEQSIAQNASTFSAHLAHLRAIVTEAGPRSLVLVDEIASGTEPAAGASLAVAVLEELLARGARGVVTTHATELKLFAHDRPHVRNASVRFDPATYAPTYELEIGSPGQSLAFALARKLGLNDRLVARAETLLSENERDYDRALADLAQVHAQAANERDALLRERALLSAAEDAVRAREAELARERERIAARAEATLDRALSDFVAELGRRSLEHGGRARVTRGQSILLGSTLEAVRGELGTRSSPVRRPPVPAEQPWATVGDVVYVESLGREATVTAERGAELQVAIGAMSSIVARSETRRLGGPPRERARDRRRAAAAVAGEATLRTASGARAELDVRGRRYVDAEPLVEKWLDEAILLGLSPLRLIHGKGTGLLGRGLQEHLRANRAVAAIRYGNADEGGGGVTIFELA